MWKIFNIQTGEMVKAGFEDEEQAKDFMEKRSDLSPEEYTVDEMEIEEEEEYIEKGSAHDEGEEEKDDAFDVTTEAIETEGDIGDVYAEEGFEDTDDDDDDDDEVEADDDDDDDDEMN